MLQLLDRFLEQPAGELAVQVGLADAHPSMRELSLIGISIPLSGGLSAKIAVLGPMRMNYGKADLRRVSCGPGDSEASRYKDAAPSLRHPVRTL